MGLTEKANVFPIPPRDQVNAAMKHMRLARKTGFSGGVRRLPTLPAANVIDPTTQGTRAAKLSRTDTLR
ncbi:hypothetical protein J6590_098536, partial [Homalodisca vitripennis]